MSWSSGTDLAAEFLGLLEESPEPRRVIAVHEAGHAVVGAALGMEPVEITITPDDDGGFTGRTRFTQRPRDRIMGAVALRELERDVVVNLAGMAAVELLVLGRPAHRGGIDSGAAEDVQKALRYARAVVAQLPALLGLPAQPEELDGLVDALLDHAYTKAHGLLRARDTGAVVKRVAARLGEVDRLGLAKLNKLFGPAPSGGSCGVPCARRCRSPCFPGALEVTARHDSQPPRRMANGKPWLQGVGP